MVSPNSFSEYTIAKVPKFIQKEMLSHTGTTPIPGASQLD
jgi:hypothetical protein